MSVRPRGGAPGDTGPTPGGGERPPPSTSGRADKPRATHQISVELANAAKSVPLARSVVIEFLRRNGSDGVEDVASLLTSELVTNAVVHGATAVGLRATLSDHRLRVEATDSSPKLPVIRRAGASATDGRGLVVLASLATEWGYEMRPAGKAVWFELAI
jgi:anti-sigma regulatory factor (Ser/Thr protein kinase)